MIGTPEQNAIINKIQTIGMSEKTAGRLAYSGVPASRYFAQIDEGRAEDLVSEFEAIGSSIGIPPALLAAIASRESRIGKALCPNGYGDHGNAFGIMQIDKRQNTYIAGYPDPKSQSHIGQAAHKLKGFLAIVSSAHPDWEPEWQLRGAVAAYNFGTNNVHTKDGIDIGTTGNDYSSDVWERARYFAGQKSDL